MGHKGDGQPRQQARRQAACQVGALPGVQEGRHRRQAAHHRAHPAGHLNDRHPEKRMQDTPNPIGQHGQEHRHPLVLRGHGPGAHQGIGLPVVIQEGRPRLRHLPGEAQIEIGIHLAQVGRAGFVLIQLPRGRVNPRQSKGNSPHRKRQCDHRQQRRPSPFEKCRFHMLFLPLLRRSPFG